MLGRGYRAQAAVGAAMAIALAMGVCSSVSAAVEYDRLLPPYYWQYGIGDGVAVTDLLADVGSIEIAWDGRYTGRVIACKWFGGFHDNYREWVMASAKEKRDSLARFRELEAEAESALRVFLLDSVMFMGDEGFADLAWAVSSLRFCVSLLADMYEAHVVREGYRGDDLLDAAIDTPMLMGRSKLGHVPGYLFYNVMGVLGYYKDAGFDGHPALMGVYGVLDTLLDELERWDFIRYEDRIAGLPSGLSPEGGEFLAEAFYD